MAEEGNFEVVVNGPVKKSVEAWRRAQRVPTTELPELSPSENERAKKHIAGAEQYARERLADRYSIEWMQERGAEFGRIVQKMLDSLAPADHPGGYRLLGVKFEGWKERWIVRVQTPWGAANIAIPKTLVDDLLDSYTVQDLDQLQSILRSNIDRKDLVGLQ